MKKTLIEIFETKDYASFKRLEGNRDIKCVKKIIESIKNVGYILNPIIVNEQMEVIDGQNRLKALEALDLPVHYYIIQGATIETARALNLGRTNWKPIDYAMSYAESGNKSYQLLIKLLANNNDYTLHEIVGITKGFIVKSGWSMVNISDGTFELTINEYNTAQELIESVNQMRHAIRGIKGAVRTTSTAIAWCLRIPGCDTKRLIEVVNNKYTAIRPVVDAELLLRDITEIYNKGLSKYKRINFDVIYRDNY